MVFSKVKIWWSAGNKTVKIVNERPTGLLTQHTDRLIVDDDDMDSEHRRRVRHVVKIQIFLAPGEWSSAKDVGPILKRCNTNQQQTFFNMENVYIFNIKKKASVLMVKNDSEILHSKKNLT